MFVLYSVVTVLLLPFVILRLYIKGARAPAYRQRIGERFTLTMPQQSKVDVWIHAVSLGEVIAVAPFIRALLATGKRLMVTTTTPTGSAKLQAEFADSIAHQYLPYDLLTLQRRFLRILQPDTVIMVETELWPNLIRAVSEAEIPLYLLNARLSARSVEGYQKIRWLITPVLRQFTKILTQSAEDAQRFQRLGVKAAQLENIGNIKFDSAPPLPKNLDIARSLQKRCAQHRFVIIAASTHASEEDQILALYAQLKQAIPHVFLMIAPRHPERFEEVERLVQQRGYQFARRSQAATWSDACDGAILDSIGELSAFYSISDIAFVGGSLVPVGGHNMLEALFAGVPVICGPHLQNFKAIARDLLAEEAMLTVEDSQQLAAEIIRLHQDHQARAELVHRAQAVLERNKGALQRYIERIFPRD
ncbi:MAG: lipid IV(A) 3-deoxy-D-manno-octulosonic acid transferase [Legionellaceae bacterium]|nr:lipid IV(A) 3-deoxy-D-manno-octulosonic acid transferase [Legionellaceae bacterium]